MDKLFLYNESKVRTEIDENGEFWFVGIDLCNILEYADSYQAIMKLDEDERRLDRAKDGSGQDRKAWTVNEAGMWSLVLSSEKPEAKTFKRWITHEVLPSLRKAGIYSTDSLNRKNVMVQELVEKIELKHSAITASKTTTKKLEKERDTMQVELIQLLKSNPDQTTMYPQEVMESLKKEIEKTTNNQEE